jgi:hypothetical protein
MRKLQLCLLLLGAGLTSIFAQTSIYLEDFDSAPYAVNTYSSSGSYNWVITSSFQVSGANADSAKVQVGDTLILETNSFSSVGYTFLTLSFDQICKIDFFDKAIVEYSTNNGSSWTQLLDADYNGGGFLFNNAFSSVSYTIWDFGNAATVPTQSWWRAEGFDLSAAANAAQVKVRFLLIDADNNGAVNNYGWLLDNIEVVGATCELVPPTVSLTGSIYQGQVYSVGPYTIQADAQDASGIASVALEYTVNGGSVNTVPMTHQGGTLYQGTIPSATVGDDICYTVIATDMASCSNQGQFPSTGCIQFTVNPNAPPGCLGTPVSQYNYEETFAGFTPGNGTTTVGTLINNWENETTDTHDWWVYNTNTNSGQTGPTADHSPGDANYMYVEASGSFANTTAVLNTPCYNFRGLTAPVFGFWYHMYGIEMGELHLDIHDGNQWIADVIPAIIGNQGNQWLYKEVNLSGYTGNIVQLRFRAIVGTGYRSDIAIDDISIEEPIPYDIALDELVNPSNQNCSGSANEFVTVKLSNKGARSLDTIPVAYQINSGAIVRDTAFITITSGGTANHTFQTPFNMSVAGTYTIDVWSELHNDGIVSNDSNLANMVMTSSLTTNFPDTTDFDTFTVGTPGIFMDDWTNATDDNADWNVHTGSTPSTNTGPSGDRTSGLGNYLYLEASGLAVNDEARLLSKCYDINNLNKPEVNFYVHMLGADMGELHVDLYINGFLIQDIIPAIIGNQGSNWNLQSIDLSPYKGKVQLVFRAIRGIGVRSDIALDDFSIKDAQPVGLEEKVRQQSFVMYPNPAKDHLYLLPHEAGSYTVLIQNTLGELVLSSTVGTSKKHIDLSPLGSGMYFVTLSNKQTKEVRKLLID